MIGADATCALCMLVLIVLFLTHRIELWHVCTMMCIRSAMQAFQAPAAAASMAMLVPRSFLPRAAGLVQMLQGLTTVVAAPLGALAMALMPLGWALGIDLVTAALGILPLLIFSIPQVRTLRKRSSGNLKEFREGVRVVWNEPGLRTLYALLGGVVLVIMPSFTLVPLLVEEYFSGAAPQVALMEGLSGVGMVTGDW
jgi:DHA3 family macrolide efflux protein-like MFS transporter